ncbi:MAG: AbrB/MazE/SpoVT family DNA-binding domain-containing protein [Actinobacteria bacterium]|nr:AbrB/MazE/SpoVT family DNA-binding domain-containing protein [Actinomycetota bacterium]
MDAVLRPKRQITIPKEICEQLGVDQGDVLELTVNNSIMIAKPKKNIALDALREIQNAFKRSGITEEELLETGEEIRHGNLMERNGEKK